MPDTGQRKRSASADQGDGAPSTKRAKQEENVNDNNLNPVATTSASKVNNTTSFTSNNNGNINASTSASTFVRDTLFPHHDARIARLNNGSFGACPVHVLKKQRELQDRWLAHPDAL
jgi:hypothetical protein